MIQMRCVTSPVRSPSLLGVVAAVLFMHGLLLLQWRVLPSMPIAASTSSRQGGLQLLLHLPQGPQSVEAEVVQAPNEMTTPVLMAHTLGAAAQIPLHTMASSAQRQTGASASAAMLASTQSPLRDGQTTLDFLLADIRSAGVKLGAMKLGLNVEADRYEAQLSWTVGATEGVANSEGTIGPALRPTSYYETGKYRVDSSVPAAVQDPLSLLWSLRNLLAALPTQGPNDPMPEWQLPVLIDGSVQSMRWRLTQEDGLVLPGGTLRAAKLVGTLDSDPLTRTNIWYAMDFDYLPVRLEKAYANGQTLDAKVSTNIQETFVRTPKNP